MGVLGQSKDRGAAAVMPTAQGPQDRTGFFSNVAAGFNQAVAGPHSTRVGEAIYQKKLYDQIITELQKEGEQGDDYIEVRPGGWGYTGPKDLPVNQFGIGRLPVKRPFRNPYVSSPSLLKDNNPLMALYGGGDREEIGQIWGAVNRVRQRKPDFLKAFPSEAALQQMAVQTRQRDLSTAQSISGKASTAGSVGGFIGGMIGSIASGDPENFVGGGFGTAAGKTFARTVVKRATEGAAANTAAALVAAPGQMTDAQHLGQEMTGADVAEQVEQGAAVGALFGSAHVAVPRVAEGAAKAIGAVTSKVAENLPAAPRNALVAASIRAGTVKDRDLLHEWSKLHAPYGVVDTSSPEERSAAHVIVRDADNKETSPLQPDAAGHNDSRLSAMAHALGVDLKTADVPSPTPIQTPTMRDHAEGGRKVATYEAAVHQAEGTGKNPDSSADGHFQFTKGTWLEYAPRVTNTEGMSTAQILALRHDLPTATKAEQLFRSDNARYLRDRGIEDSPGNLSLAHFLGKSDAAKVLRADPSTPIERLVDPRSLAANRRVLEGKSASEVVAWAHKRIGAAVDAPVARSDAVPDADPLDEGDYTDVPYEAARFSPDEVETDAPLMQYKSGGDQNGVTGKLKDVTAWNPLMSSEILVWEANDGRRVVVDGHQRLGLAKRLYADDSSISLPALVVKESDGVTPAQARVLGALRNINLGTGSLLDNARVLRDAPNGADAIKGAENRREIEGLSRLSYEAFGAAINDVIPPRIAAEIGKHAPPESHAAMVDLLAKERIRDPREAATIVRQAVTDGLGSANEEQLTLLGDTPQQSLYKPIARILDAARKRLREEKRTFRVLSEKAGRIEQAGNVLDRTANEERVIGSDEALGILDATAHSAGPVRSALINAARAELSGARRGDAVNRFLDDLSGIDLRAAARGVEPDEPTGLASGEARERDAAKASDEELAGSNGPELFDHAIAARDAAAPFSDPVGPAAKQQTALLEHGLLMDARADTRGQGVFYHGARGEVPQLSEGYYNPNNIYGGFDTFYSTDALDIARGYQRRRSTGKVYRVEEKQPVNFFDMEQQQPVSYWDELFALGDLASAGAEEAAGIKGTANLREVMDEIRDLSAGEGVSKDEVQEIFDTAIYNLRQRGFGGMTHIGGLKTGREPHTVKVFFDAPNQLELHEVPAPREMPNAADESSAPSRAQGDNQQPQGVGEAEGQSEGGVSRTDFTEYEHKVGDTEADVERKVAVLNSYIDQGGATGDAAIRAKNRLFDAFDAATAPSPAPSLFDIPETGFRLSEEGEAKPIHEIMQEAESDELAAGALRACLGGGA